MSTPIKQNDIILLILDYLKQHNLIKTQLALEEESQIKLHKYPKDIEFCRMLILDGEWSDVENFIKPFQSRKNIKYYNIIFEIYKQRLLEELYKEGDENEIANLIKKIKEDQILESECSNLIKMLETNDRTMFQNWSISKGRLECFEKIRKQIENVIPANEDISVEPNRLLKIIKDSIQHQHLILKEASKKSKIEPGILKDLIPLKDRENFNSKHLPNIKIKIIPSQNDNKDNEFYDQTTNFDSKRFLKTKNMFPEYISTKTTYNLTNSTEKIKREIENEKLREKANTRENNININMQKNNLEDNEQEDETNEKNSNNSENSQNDSKGSEKEQPNKKEEIELEIKDQEEIKLSIKDIDERGIIEDIQPIRSGCFSPDGQFIAIGTNSRSIKIASLKNVIELVESPSSHEGKKADLEILFSQNNHHKGSIYCIDWNSSSRIIATGSNDKTIKLLVNPMEYSNQNEVLEMQIPAHDGIIRTLSFNPNNEIELASGGNDGSKDPLLKIWSTEKGLLIAECKGHSKDIFSVKFLNDGNSIISAGHDSNIIFWDTKTCKPRLKINAKEKGLDLINEIAIFEGVNDQVIAGHIDGLVSIWSFDGKLINKYKYHNDEIRSVSIYGNNEYFASASFDSTIQIVNSISYNIETTLTHSDKIVCIRWHPFLPILLSCSVDKTAKIWSV